LLEMEKASSIQPPAVTYANPEKRVAGVHQGPVDPFTARILSARDEQQRF